MSIRDRLHTSYFSICKYMHTMHTQHVHIYTRLAGLVLMLEGCHWCVLGLKTHPAGLRRDPKAAEAAMFEPSSRVCVDRSS